MHNFLWSVSSKRKILPFLPTLFIRQSITPHMIQRLPAEITLPQILPSETTSCTQDAVVPYPGYTVFDGINGAVYKGNLMGEKAMDRRQFIFLLVSKRRKKARRRGEKGGERGEREKGGGWPRREKCRPVKGWKRGWKGRGKNKGRMAGQSRYCNALVMVNVWPSR